MKTFQKFLSESSQRPKTSMDEFKKLVHKFLPYVSRELKIKNVPTIYFEDEKINSSGIVIVRDSNFSQTKKTFGQTNKKNKIVVNVENRHPLDALRTLAHELVHYHQHITGVYGTGATGSKTENEASAISSIIMRKFNYSHPNVFKLPPL